MALEPIPLTRLALALIPVALVVALMARLGVGAPKALYAFARMFAQLLLIGYALVFIFDADSALVVLGVLAAMLVAAGWIALNTVSVGKRALFPLSLLSISFGAGLTLAVVVFGVLSLDPWYQPNAVVPLAGMIFSAAMTSLSLAAERLGAERAAGAEPAAARRAAFQAAMIPIMNALFAVGLVALPGMMTGQILSGVSPLIAARYQIMVMCMMFSSAGLATAAFLFLTQRLNVLVQAEKNDALLMRRKTEEET